ncbi:MAG: ADP-ribose pyrophosphatase [Methylotenera sp.]|nr:MAG: ADP-ribose pyrophosphatase [Methylotenera sp.]
MSYKYDYIVYIGRFAPFHIGHNTVLQQALTQAKNVIVLVGSSFRPRNVRNPWTYIERETMIYTSLSGDQFGRTHIKALRDYLYNEDAWVRQIQNVVDATIFNIERNKANVAIDSTPLKIGIIGHSKDKTSGYLNMFPQWEPIEHPLVQNIHGSDIREMLFDNKDLAYITGIVPPTTLNHLQNFIKTDDYVNLCDEHFFLKKYKSAWAAAPYAPMFLTTDAIVTQSGHVLMVTRGANPGAGLDAFPGGFLEQDEFMECGALRELKEETKIDVPVKVLRGCIKGSKIFDHPLRSLRGRTVTQAFHIELPPGPLPKVKGSDDARLAKWVPFNDVKSENCFEDHYDMFEYFIK